jgi:hypothetical protein
VRFPGQLPVSALGLRLQGAPHDSLPRPRETVEAGEAFYLSPGHAPAAEAGTEFVQFSPPEQMAATTDAIKKAMTQNA